MRLSFGELLVILILALLIFGPNKLPELGEAIGKGFRSFKDAASGNSLEDKDEEGKENK